MTQVTIRRLGHKGDGITEGPVRVPLTLPGEVVEGDLREGTLENVRIVEPSGDRVKPPCRHFKSCGGCQLQHASDTFLADWKTAVVREALHAQGLEADMAPIIVSPSRTRRRAVFSALRTKKGSLAGFHAKGSEQVIEIPDCQLLHPDLMQALPVASEFALVGASRKSSLNVTAAVSLNGLDISVSGGKPLDGPFRMTLAGLAERYDLARLVWNGEEIATRLPPYQQFGVARVVPPPGAFLQATLEGERALQHRVAEIVAGSGRIVDLFAGCGTFSLPLAQIAQVHAVEGSAPMLQALDRGWRNAHGLKAVSHEARDLFREPLIKEELTGFDAAVIDPPRAGAKAQVATLANSGIPIIAFVSCNPVTFARDARTLVDAGYVLGQVQVVDQFRWSNHVELVADFRRPQG